MQPALMIIFAFSLTAAPEILVAAGAAVPAQRLHEHPAELHPGHVTEPFIPRVCWLVASAVVGYGIYRLGEEFLIRACEDQQPSLESDWVWGGGWASLDGTSTVVIPEDSTADWVCFRGHQCFRLVAQHKNAMEGIATGNVICAAGGHKVGTFELRPWELDKNKFELVFDQTNVIGVFERPE